MLVGGPECRDIARADLPRVDQIGAAPTERRLPKLTGQQVARKAGELSVSVRERANCDQTMAESDGDFIERVGVVLDQ